MSLLFSDTKPSDVAMVPLACSTGFEAAERSRVQCASIWRPRSVLGFSHKCGPHREDDPSVPLITAGIGGGIRKATL